MTRIEEIILEHTRLAKEFIDLPFYGGDTPEELLQYLREKQRLRKGSRSSRKKYYFK